jgi:hypothetical protein
MKLFHFESPIVIEVNKLHPTFVVVMGHLLISCLDHICDYMLCTTTFMYLMENIVKIVIYD